MIPPHNETEYSRLACANTTTYVYCDVKTAGLACFLCRTSHLSSTFLKSVSLGERLINFAVCSTRENGYRFKIPRYARPCGSFRSIGRLFRGVLLFMGRLWKRMTGGQRRRMSVKPSRTLWDLYKRANKTAEKTVADGELFSRQPSVGASLSEGARETHSRKQYWNRGLLALLVSLDEVRIRSILTEIGSFENPLLPSRELCNI